MNACPPGLKSPHSAAGIADYLGELLKLSPAQLRGVGIDLRGRLGATIPTATTTYNVPSDQDLVVFGISAYYRSTNLATEPVLNANLTLSPSDLQVARLSNCIGSLKNKDRNLEVFDAQAIVLGSIAAPMGNKLVFPVQAPLLFPRTHTIRADFTLQSVAAAIAGNDADYGFLLEGILIPTRS